MARRGLLQPVLNIFWRQAGRQVVGFPLRRAQCPMPMTP